MGDNYYSMFAKRIKRRRNSLRLKDFDYSSEGYYFVTISFKERKKCFENKKAQTIIKRQIYDIEKRFDILIDCFVIMSDHIHMIIVLNEAKRVNLSKVIQAFKSLVTKEFKEKLGFRNKFWQRGFYDRIIRNEKDYLEKKQYILNNPLKEELLGRRKLRDYAER
jgi:REP element-mobilizing transposase RayT